MSYREEPVWRSFRLLVVVNLILLSLQGWSGDYVNVFVTTHPQKVAQTVQGFVAAVTASGPPLVWHALEGVLILVLGVIIAALSYRLSSLAVRVASALGVLSVLSAGIGGFLFVTSGFSAGGSSMQMGGSYIASYALYFITLWYTK
jgi:uncharacterized membrane protein